MLLRQFWTFESALLIGALVLEPFPRRCQKTGLVFGAHLRSVFFLIDVIRRRQYNIYMAEAFWMTCLFLIYIIRRLNVVIKSRSYVYVELYMK